MKAFIDTIGRTLSDLYRETYGQRIVRCKDPLDGIDLVAEVHLIQQKKSKLSASQRRRVMREVSMLPEFESNTEQQ